MRRRVLASIPALFGVTVIIFLAMRVLPGDPLAMITGEGASYILKEEDLRAARASLGLDRPLHEQYLSWMADVARGELGKSFWRKEPIRDLILRRGMEDKKAYQLGLNNSGTARGFMQILLKLARREVISPADSDEMMQILSQQQFNEMIPAKLPADVRLAHKTGSTSDYFHDVGIIYPPSGKPIVLSILTKGYAEAEEQAAHTFIASLAKAVYEYWE